MRLFERPSSNYHTSDDIPKAIANDEASPLRAISLLIEDANQVLDIGCGNGMLSRIVQVHGKNAAVDGVEPNPVAAEIAAKYCRKVFNSTVDVADVDYSKYNWVVAADVLEHFVDPQLFLQSLVSKMAPNAKLAVSLPNVSFGSIRISLLNGKFEYVDSGLLEKTHLRFFTRELALRMFESVGLNCSEEVHLRRNFWETEVDLSTMDKIPIIQDPLADVYQFLFVLQKNPTPKTTRLLGKRNTYFSQQKDRLKAIMRKKI